jgi:hypothetical protein
MNLNANRLTVAAVLGLGSLITPAARAINGCSNSTVNGNYAIQISGTSAPTIAASIGGLAVPASISQAASVRAINGGASNVPADGIMRLFLDGNGLLFGNASVSLDGTWLQGNLSGQYTVNQDCSASFSLSDPSGATGNFAGVVVGQGDAVLVLQTDNGTGVSGVFKKTRGFCQTADLAGTFGIQYSGSAVGNGSPYSSVGILILDGQGDVSGAESRFSSGATSQVTSSGSIAVNPDCTAVITLTSQGAATQSITFAGTLTVDNKQLLLVQSDAGMAATGTMIAQ